MKNYLSGNRIFIKIFLWFWLTFLLIAVIFFISPLLIQSNSLPGGWRATTTTALIIYGQTAAEIYEREGAESLKKYLERIETTSEFRGFLLNKEQKELSDRKLSADFYSILNRQNEKDEPLFEPNRFSVLAKVEFSTQSNQYIFLCEIPRKITYSMFAVEPTVRFLRLSLLLFVSLFVCFWLARYLTKPIIKLNNAAKRISKGDLTTRIGSIFGKRRDELTNLSQTFDQMAEQLESLIKSQSRLLGDISHELRSPLARLQVAASLAREAEDKAEIEDSIDVIEREAANINEMINQLLTLTKLETLGQTASFTKIKIDSLIREIVSDAQFETTQKKRKVEIKRLDEGSLSGERKLLRSAIENIIRNAVKYTPEETTVEIEGSRQADKFVIKVRDYGNGVPEAELTKIFQPFYRVAPDRDRSSGGTGLGLAIAQRAVKLHNGTIEAVNAVEGGLSVTITLPIE
jgi:signal transduction histidine kinase